MGKPRKKYTRELIRSLCETLVLLRKYPEALKYADLAIATRPEIVDSYFWKAWVHLKWQGDMRRVQEAIDEARHLGLGSRSGSGERRSSWTRTSAWGPF